VVCESGRAAFRREPRAVVEQGGLGPGTFAGSTAVVTSRGGGGRPADLQVAGTPMASGNGHAQHHPYAPGGASDDVPPVDGADPFAGAPIDPADRRAPLPHNLDAEAAVLGGTMLRNELARAIELSSVDFYDPRHAAVWSAMAELAGDGSPLDEVTIAARLQQMGKLDAVGPAYLLQLGLRVPAADSAIHYAGIVRELATKRRLMLAMSDLISRAPSLEAEELALETARLSAAVETRRPTLRRAPDLVDAILAHAGDPWLTLELAGGEIASVRAGALVVVMGPTGAGKSSLVAGIVVRHARRAGPAIYLSRELPADELGARIVGMQCDASWPEVLRGQIAREHMAKALDLPRLVIIERDDATLAALCSELRAARVSHPDSPVLAAVDYAQIIGEAGDDQRVRVSDTMAQIDRLAREHSAVVLVVSQMSRANARSARAGESVGAETTDGGAESAAIERYASLTLTIGCLGPVADDGSQAAQISIGKYRMGSGDRVLPMRYEGRSGRWRVDGEARPAAEVRAESRANREDSALRVAVGAVRDTATRAPEPLTREDLVRRAGVKAEIGRSAIARLLANGELVEVQQRKPRSRAWKLWVPTRAAEAGIPLATAVPESGR
jgi:replicative DNA helicase